jgi:hypothetical protein
MVQPKYSPEEALERVKLMMKYDTSKTLNENKEIILKEDASAVANLILKASDPGGGQGTDEKFFVAAIKSIATPLEYYQANSILKNNSSYKKDIVAFINDEFGSGDEKYVEEIKQHLEKLGFKVEITLKKNVNNRDISYFDGGFKITYAPPATNTGTGTNTTPVKTTKTAVGGGGSSSPKSKYTQCDGTYKVMTCKSEVIRKVQACLGMPAKYQTGNFGPMTQGELDKKFPQFPQFKDSFTDDDVYEIICKKTSLKDAGLQPVNNNQTQSNQSFQPGQLDSIAKSKGLTFDQNKFGYLKQE